MAYRDRKSTQVKGAILLFLLRIVYWMPAFVPRCLSLFVGKLNYWFNGKATQVVRTNLKLCYPLLNEQQANRLIKDFNQQNAYLTGEFATAWLGDKNAIAAKINQVNQRHLVDDAIAQQQPIIFAVLHIGNWEFFWHWVQMNYPAYGMYQPAKFKQLDKVLLKARSLFGGKAFATDPKGMMGLLRELKRGGIMMLLPDQAPREGAGIYSPFFGHPAYTMTLLHKFVNKSGAKLLFGSCLRTEDGKRFDINIEAAQFDYAGKEVNEFNQQMNLQIEKMIGVCPQQYQWSYKRFKRQPQGNDLYQ